MLGRALPLLGMIALFAAAVPSGAAAQCRLCSAPDTGAAEAGSESTPLSVEVDTALDFDRLILMDESRGEARIEPNGNRSASGSIGMVSGRAAVARITVRGEPGRAVDVILPDRLELIGMKGGTIRIESILSDLPRVPMLDAGGQLTILIGGELIVSGDADGDYRGDVPVRVDYQ